jgi:hypothetical protein
MQEVYIRTINHRELAFENYGDAVCAEGPNEPAGFGDVKTMIFFQSIEEYNDWAFEKERTEALSLLSPRQRAILGL